MNTHDKLKLAAELGVEMPHYTNTDNPIDFPVRGAAHDDTALLRMALEALHNITKHFGFTRLHKSTLADTTVRGEAHKAITALRERLGEKA